ALMPPLCVTGFGLANLIKDGLITESFGTVTSLNNLEITLNSFYLFFLNASLVAAATYVVVRMVNFPYRGFTNESERRKTNLFVLAFSVLIVIPSVFILVGVFQETNEKNEVKVALEQSFGQEINYVDDWKIIDSDTTKSVLVKVYGPSISKSLDYYKGEISSRIPDFDVEILTTSDVDLDRVESGLSEVTRLDSLVQKIISKEQAKESQLVEALRSQLSSLSRDTSLEATVSKEVLAVYGDYLKSCFYVHPVALDSTGLLIIEWQKPFSQAVKNRVELMVKAKAGVSNLVVARQ
ncbi:MAG: hypothetical protein HKN16_11245, partial [Saprospiraceae bacterium]|nr:hypothetical protein [Saprospiraceae bacterium]